MGGLSACRGAGEDRCPLTALTNQGEALQHLTVKVGKGQTDVPSIPSILRRFGARSGQTEPLCPVITDCL